MKSEVFNRLCMGYGCLVDVHWGSMSSPESEPIHVTVNILCLLLLLEIVDAPGDDGNASMPEQVKRPNPLRKIIIINCN